MLSNPNINPENGVAYKKEKCAVESANFLSLEEVFDSDVYVLLDVDRAGHCKCKFGKDTLVHITNHIL